MNRYSKETPVNPQRPQPRARKVLPTREQQREQFASFMHTIVLSFSRIQKQVHSENDEIRKEWRQARGLATWTEERLEVVEARLDRLEQHTGMPPDPEVEKLRAILANYRPDVLGVKPIRGSMTGKPG
jgi:hypothetical protein